MSHPLLATDPLITQGTPFFSHHAESTPPIDSRFPAVNPASSIKELLRAYGVTPRPVKYSIPPPPARAIFPASYRNLSRVHVHQRPRSSRSFSRASSRPFTHAFPRSSRLILPVPSVVVSRRPPTRSDTSSDVLGLSPLCEETAGIQGTPVRIPGSEWSNTDERPTTATSTVPRIRSRNPVAEVVSCATQTSPQPTVTTFSPTVYPTRPSSNTETCKNAQRSVGGPSQSYRGKTPHAMENSINPQESSAQQCDNNHDEYKASKPRRRRRRRARKSHVAVEESVGLTETDGVYPRFNYPAPRQSQISEVSVQPNIADIESVSLAMEKYYRSQGINTMISIDSNLLNKKGVTPPVNAPSLQNSPLERSGLSATRTERQSSRSRFNEDISRRNTMLTESTTSKFITPIRSNSISYVRSDPHYLRREAAKHLHNKRQSDVRDSYVYLLI